MTAAQSALDEIALRLGPVRLSVCPGLGGAITRLSFDDVDVLRPWDGSDKVRRTACFVLAPFSNRVAGGAFEHEGQRYPLLSLSEEHALPIHGVAWKRAWTVREQSDSSLTLIYSHLPRGEDEQAWPFAFEVEHRIQLDDSGVSLHLTLRNTDTRSMPAGLGWHPYFLRREECRLRFAAQSVWLNDSQNLPSHLSKVPQDWDFSTIRPLQDPGLDNCFVGRTEPIQIHWPQEGLELTMDASETLDHLVVFTPPVEMGIFAVEPVSHANNALTMEDPTDNGTRILASGETMQASCRLQFQRTATSGT